MDIAHNERHGGFDAIGRGRESFVAGLGVSKDALEAENTELTPAGGEVGVGYLLYGSKGHKSIIRFGLHRNWIARSSGSMQGRRPKMISRRCAARVK